MTLVREKFADSRDEDVRVLPGFVTGINPPEEPNEDEDLDYSDDDLGENTEVTPLGDAVDDEDIENLGPDDDDDLLSDDDDDWDVETEQDLDDVDEVDDIDSINNGPDDDDDLLMPDDDDDEEIENPDVIPAIDPDEDELFEEDEGVGADDSVTETDAPQVFDTPDTGVSSRKEDRRTGRMIDHEPGSGSPGFNGV